MKNLRYFVFVQVFLLYAAGAQAVTCTETNKLPSNPDNIYIDHGDGTVTDTRTNLMWKKCEEGQVYSNDTCTGAVRTLYDWKEAVALGASDRTGGYTNWRLPNIKELSSLFEECRTDPAINNTIFPAINGTMYYSMYYSSTPFGYDSSHYVDFSGYGGIGVVYRLLRSHALLVRSTTTTASGTTNAMAQYDCLFNWGEDNYPTIFQPSRRSSQTTSSYYYRYYSGTDAYLGVSTGSNPHLYFVAPGSGVGSAVDLDLAAQWVERAGCNR